MSSFRKKTEHSIDCFLSLNFPLQSILMTDPFSPQLVSYPACFPMTSFYDVFFLISASVSITYIHSAHQDLALDGH